LTILAGTDLRSSKAAAAGDETQTGGEQRNVAELEGHSGVRALSPLQSRQPLACAYQERRHVDQQLVDQVLAQ
jgi:hypothetical protein